MRETKRSGFTLVELMIVVAVIGILAMVAMPKFAALVNTSREGATKGNLGSIRSALSIYYADMEGTFPADDLSSLTVGGKYLTAIPKVTLPSHSASSAVCVSLLSAPGVCRLGLGAPSGYDGQLGPIWVYWEQSTPPLMGPTRNWGDVWVGCMHTDSKGSTWTAY